MSEPGLLRAVVETIGPLANALKETTTADDDSPGTGDDDVDWLVSHGWPLAMMGLPRGEAPYARECGPGPCALLVEWNFLPNAVAVLRRIIRTDRRISEDPRARQAYSQVQANVGPLLNPLLHVNLTGVTLCVLIDWASEFADGGRSMKGRSGPATLPPDVTRAMKTLSEQLLSPDTLLAMAEAARWAAGKLQRAQQQPGSAAGVSELQTERFCAAIKCTGGMLNAALVCTLMDPARAPISLSAAAVAPASKPQLQLLRDVRSSGLLAAVCGAVLDMEGVLGGAARGFGSGRGAGGSGRGRRDGGLSGGGTCGIGSSDHQNNAQVWEIRCSATTLALQAIAKIVMSGMGTPGAQTASLELLATPKVTRLRLTALEQLAAAAPPRPGGQGGSGGGGGPTSGATAAAVAEDGGASVGPSWALLAPLDLAPRPELLRDAYEDLVDAVMLPLEMQAHMEPQSGSSAQAAQRLAALMPPLPRMAALVAASCRAVAARLKQKEGLADEAAAAVGIWDKDPRSLAGLLAGLKLAKEHVQMPAGATVEALPDMMEACGWAMNGLATAVAAEYPESSALRMEMYESHVLEVLVDAIQDDWTQASPAQQQEALRRLLPSRPLASLDCLLRHRLSKTADAKRLGSFFRACICLTHSSKVLEAHIEQQQRQQQPPGPGSPGKAAGSRYGSQGDKSHGVHPQELLGLFITLAKAARREGAAAVAALQAASGSAHTPPGRQGDAVPTAALGPWVAGAVPSCIMQLVTLLAELTAEAEDGGGCDTPGLRRLCSALREAVELGVRSMMPLMEALLDDGAPLARGQRAMRADPDTPAATNEDMSTDCLVWVGMCLQGAVRVLPPGEVLALEPQRLLVRAARRLQEQAAAMQRQGGWWARARSEGDFDVELWVAAAMGLYTALCLFTAHEGLVKAAAGWLRGEPLAGAAEGGQAGVQVGSRTQERLDVERLAAVMEMWHPSVAAKVRELQRLAVDAAGEGSGPGGAGVSGGDTTGSTAQQPSTQGPLGPAATRLMGFARQVLDELGKSNAPIPALGGQAPQTWPPRVLRLCCNAACTNFSKPAEAELPLKQCTGCEAVRYCGRDCQRQDWREGGHRERCTGLKSAAKRAVTTG